MKVENKGIKIKEKKIFKAIHNTIFYIINFCYLNRSIYRNHVFNNARKMRSNTLARHA